MQTVVLYMNDEAELIEAIAYDQQTEASVSAVANA
jgi:hypothetical protein